MFFIKGVTKILRKTNDVLDDIEEDAINPYGKFAFTKNLMNCVVFYGTLWIVLMCGIIILKETGLMPPENLDSPINKFLNHFNPYCWVIPKPVSCH